MDTNYELTLIHLAADNLPEPARSFANAELGRVPTLTLEAQAQAIIRWQDCMRTWPAMTQGVAL